MPIEKEKSTSKDGLKGERDKSVGDRKIMILSLFIFAIMILIISVISNPSFHYSYRSLLNMLLEENSSVNKTVNETSVIILEKPINVSESSSYSQESNASNNESHVLNDNESQAYLGNESHVLNDNESPDLNDNESQAYLGNEYHVLNDNESYDLIDNESHVLNDNESPDLNDNNEPNVYPRNESSDLNNTESSYLVNETDNTPENILEDTHHNISENVIGDIPQDSIQNMTDELDKLEEQPEKVKDDKEFDVIVKSSYIKGEDLVIIFYHNSKYLQPIRIDGNVNYSLNKNESRRDEPVKLTIYNWHDDYFRMIVGRHSEVLQFGKRRKFNLKTEIRDSKGKSLNAEIKFIDPILNKTELKYNTGHRSRNIEEGRYKVELRTIEKHNPVKKIIFNDVDVNTDLNLVVNIDDVEEDKHDEFSQFVEVYAIDPTGFNFTNATVTVIASGTELYKCKDWDFGKQACNGDWELFKTGLVPGEEYNFTLTPEDPGFAEGVYSVDVALAPINESTFIIAFINDSSGDLKFDVMDTNGSILVGPIKVDTVETTKSRVSLTPINSTCFVIGWIDGQDRDVRAAVYKTNGANIVSSFTVDNNVGNNGDVSVAEIGNGDRFAVCYANDNDNDADFKIYYNNGTLAVGESHVDGNMNPDKRLQNYIECSGFNSSRWVYMWYDDASDDATFSTLNLSGDDILSKVDLDKNIGNDGQVAVTTLDDDKFAVVWFDSSDKDITISVKYVNGTDILSPTDIDTNVNNRARVAIGTIDNPDGNGDMFVVAWYTKQTQDIRAAVYYGNGTEYTSPFTVESNPKQEALLDVMGKYPLTNISICKGKFIIAYTNSSDDSIFKGYYINGTEWDGVCDITPPAITFVSPTECNQIITRNWTYVNVTLNETPDWIRLEWNGTSNESMSGSGLNWYKNKTNLAEGNYTFKVFVNNSAGNMSESSTCWVYVNTTPSTHISDGETLTDEGSPYIVNKIYYASSGYGTDRVKLTASCSDDHIDEYWIKARRIDTGEWEYILGPDGCAINPSSLSYDQDDYLDPEIYDAVQLYLRFTDSHPPISSLSWNIDIWWGDNAPDGIITDSREQVYDGNTIIENKTYLLPSGKGLSKLTLFTASLSDDEVRDFRIYGRRSDTGDWVKIHEIFTDKTSKTMSNELVNPGLYDGARIYIKFVSSDQINIAPGAKWKLNISYADDMFNSATPNHFSEEDGKKSSSTFTVNKTFHAYQNYYIKNFSLTAYTNDDYVDTAYVKAKNQAGNWVKVYSRDNIDDSSVIHGQILDNQVFDALELYIKYYDSGSSVTNCDWDLKFWQSNTTWTNSDPDLDYKKEGISGSKYVTENYTYYATDFGEDGDTLQKVYWTAYCDDDYPDILRTYARNATSHEWELLCEKTGSSHTKTCDNTTSLGLYDAARTYVRYYDSSSSVSRGTWYAKVWFNITSDITPPAITFVSPTDCNTTITNNWTFVNVTLNETPDWIRLEWNGSNETMSGSGQNWYKNMTSLANGNYTFKVWANDSMGNMGHSSVCWVNISYTPPDTTPPIVHLVNPVNQTMTSNLLQTFTCNITDDSAISNLTLFIWNSTEGNIYTNTKSLSGTSNQTSWSYSLPYDDVFKWNCKGYDNSGNNNWSKEDNYTITLDTASPTINFVPPTTSSGNHSQSYILCNVTASDAHLDTIIINLYNSSGLKYSHTCSSSPCYYNFSGLPDGTYYLNSSANDSLSHTNSTPTREIHLDTTSPAWDQTPQNQTITYGQSFSYDLNASDPSGIDIYWVNDTSNFAMNGSTGELKNNTLLAAGLYWLNISVNDTFGNILSSIIFVNVTQGVTGLTLSSSPSWSVTYPSQTNVSCVANNSEVTVHLYRNGSSVSNPDVQTLGVGHYQYTCNTSGSQNYSSASVTDELNISRRPSNNEEEKSEFDVTLKYTCAGQSLTTTVIDHDTNDPVQNAHVMLSYLISNYYRKINEGYTDSHGTLELTIPFEAEYKLSVTKEGYDSYKKIFNIDCTEECLSDIDCPPDFICLNHSCSQLTCDCGYIENHTCINYDCCLDSDCDENEKCINHECVLRRVDIEINYSDNHLIVNAVYDDGYPVANYHIKVRTKSGKILSAITDTNGRAEIYLSGEVPMELLAPGKILNISDISPSSQKIENCEMLGIDYGRHYNLCWYAWVIIGIIVFGVLSLSVILKLRITSKSAKK